MVRQFLVGPYFLL